uniref:Uncharacterized protein n=1 Tax=Arundo donax TaxID=35708 RepID=A0A0A9EP11_ARUDO
MAAAREERGV